MTRFTVGICSLLLLSMSGWFGCATAPAPAALAGSKCYTGSLSVPGAQLLHALDPVGYAEVAAGDLFITPECAMAQIQGLTDEIRGLDIDIP